MIKQEVWAVTAEVDKDTHRVVSNGLNEMAHVFKNEAAAIAYRAEHAMVQEPFYTQACVVVDRETFADLERKSQEQLTDEARQHLAEWDSIHGSATNTGWDREQCSLVSWLGSKVSEARHADPYRAVIRICSSYGYDGVVLSQLTGWLESTLTDGKFARTQLSRLMVAGTACGWEGATTTNFVDWAIGRFRTPENDADLEQYRQIVGVAAVDGKSPHVTMSDWTRDLRSRMEIATTGMRNVRRLCLDRGWTTVSDATPNNDVVAWLSSRIYSKERQSEQAIAISKERDTIAQLAYANGWRNSDASLVDWLTGKLQPQASLPVQSYAFAAAQRIAGSWGYDGIGDLGVWINRHCESLEQIAVLARIDGWTEQESSLLRWVSNTRTVALNATAMLDRLRRQLCMKHGWATLSRDTPFDDVLEWIGKRVLQHPVYGEAAIVGGGSVRVTVHGDVSASEAYGAMKALLRSLLERDAVPGAKPKPNPGMTVNLQVNGKDPVEFAKDVAQATASALQTLTVNVEGAGADPEPIRRAVVDELTRNGWTPCRGGHTTHVFCTLNVNNGQEDTRQRRIDHTVELLRGYGWTTKRALEIANHSIPDTGSIPLDKDREAAVNRITAEIDKHRQAGNPSLALEYEQLLATYLAR